MKFFKLFIAAAFFVTSITFEEQVLVTKAGIDSTWDVTFSTPVSHAAAAAYQSVRYFSGGLKSAGKIS